MKISHRQLESCNENPQLWVVTTRDGSPFRSIGFAYATQLAIYRFHESGSEEESQEYLSQICSRRGLKNAARISEAEDNLRDYIEWTMNASPIIAAWKVRIDFDIGSNWRLGGEVSRVDIDIAADRYRGILLGARNDDWRQELRMPLLQRTLAEKFERQEEEIEIGVQDFDGSNLEVQQYSKNDVQDAVEKARNLANFLYANW